MIVDSTNPRIMADNIRELARNGGSDLPDVTIADNGKVLGVVEGSWNKTDIPSDVVDYSTTEQDTMRKWIDGKTIYQKTVTGENLVTETDLTGDAVETLVSAEGYVTDGDGTAVTLTSYMPGNNRSWCSVIKSALTNHLLISTDTGFVGHPYAVTIYYTKPDPVPSNETKKTTKRKTTKGEN